MSLCPVCGRRYSPRSNLRQHITEVQGGHWSYGCPRCSYRTPRKSSMDAHIAGKHQPMGETIVETRVSEPAEALGGVWERVETRVEIRKEWGHRWENGVPVVTEDSGGAGASRGERLIAGIFRDLVVEFVTEKSFDDLRGVRGGPLRFDFVIRDGSKYLLVEYDGEGHFGPVRFGGMSYYEAVRDFGRTVERDRRKNDYCRTNGHPLLRVSFRERTQARYIVSAFVRNNLGDASASSVESSNWRVSAISSSS